MTAEPPDSAGISCTRMCCGRARERADLLDFIRHPPGRVPEHLRSGLSQLAQAIERGSHVGGGTRLYEPCELVSDDENRVKELESALRDAVDGKPCWLRRAQGLLMRSDLAEST